MYLICQIRDQSSGIACRHILTLSSSPGTFYIAQETSVGSILFLPGMPPTAANQFKQVMYVSLSAFQVSTIVLYNVGRRFFLALNDLD